MKMYLFQDWKCNKYNPKSRIILLLYRLSNQIANSNIIINLLGLPIIIFYRIFVEWFLGVEIPFKVKIGKELSLYHGQALVINKFAIIGDNCVLRNSTTIGNKVLPDGSFSESPIIGNNVDIGANSVIIGPIKIGNNVTVGAGSVVVKDVEDNVVICGNPAKILKKK